MVVRTKALLSLGGKSSKMKQKGKGKRVKMAFESEEEEEEAWADDEEGLEEKG